MHPTTIAMAEKSIALRHALVAFSALVFSKGGKDQLEYAYREGLNASKELDDLRSKEMQMDRIEGELAIATTLTLATFMACTGFNALTLAFSR